MKTAWTQLLPDNLDIDVRQAFTKQGKRWELPPNNDKQKEAIRNALTHKFTLIQGPPGNDTLSNLPFFGYFLSV